MYRWRGRKWPPQPMEPIARHSGGRARKRGCGHVGNRPHRSNHVGVSRKVLIDDWASPTGCERSQNWYRCWHEGCIYA